MEPNTLTARLPTLVEVEIPTPAVGSPAANMRIDFTFSDTISGYVVDFMPTEKAFILATTDGRQYKLNLIMTTYARRVGNRKEP